ncbi:OpgC domain-containing protein [Pseudorhodobacter sp.]|uniref:OpgC family protein n=1 Tax=Pseudorhodobacter sp. TaxID=1934400 RepID=UPI002AFF814A|nr:OpgC domain-containing protein [Pseudorhodobacter sp.]
MPKHIHLRDNRIDLLRGIALLMIFINHIPGTIWENFTSRNFGFSDAAEGFVLMSGIATGLAYGPAFLNGPVNLAMALRPWRRAVTLWWVHCVVIFCILALFVLAINQPGIALMAERRNILLAAQDPAGLMLALVSLGHHFAYADILPLYVVLLLAAPAVLFVAARWPRLTMAAALVLWFVVGFWKIKMPTWPTENGWAFNPLAWQVLFVAGILTGLAMRQGRRFLPIRRWALRLAIAFLILSALWVQVPILAAWGGHGLWILYEYAGFPPVFTSFDKSFVFLPRLLHCLALAYTLSVLPAVKTLAASPTVAPIILLGRHSLPVFATGSVLAYVAQVIKALQPASFLLDSLLIATGLCLLFLVAHLRDKQKRAKTIPAMTLQD